MEPTLECMTHRVLAQLVLEILDLFLALDNHKVALEEDKHPPSASQALHRK